jgi:hypothetical protein
MRWKILAALACLAVVILLVVDLAYLHFSSSARLRVLDSASVVTQVKQLKNLVTVRYSLQRVVGVTEPRGAFGEESILLMVQGDVQAGVDLAKLKREDIVRTGKQAITIHLPHANLFAAYIDEKQTKVWDRHITWWTPWIPPDPDLEHKARLRAIDDIQSAAISMGILNEAQKNAENAICDFLKAFQIEVNFQ